MASKLIEFSALKSNINGDNVTNDAEHETNISSLPPPILCEILTRVPTKTVFGCKTVCKPWIYLIDNSFFKSQHFSKSNNCPLFIFNEAGFSNANKCNPITMHLIEGENVLDLDPESYRLNSCIQMLKDAKSPRAGNYGKFLRLNSKATSCEGIVCSAPRHGGDRDHVIIFNPVTSEYVIVNLFKCNRPGQSHESIFIGLGFSRTDKKFKMLRISRFRTTNYAYLLPTWWLETCIVGTRGWEQSEVPFEPMINFSRKVDDVIYASGTIYWIYRGDKYICSYDFDEKVFRVLPLHQMDDVTIQDNTFIVTNIHMGVLGGSLCVSLICPRDGHVELWTIDKNGGQIVWRKILNIQTVTTWMEHVGYSQPRGNYKAIKYLEGGKILLHDWRDTFRVYDPVTKIDKSIRILGNTYLNKEDETYLNFQVIPHPPSLVSLSDTLNIKDDSVVKDVQRNPTMEMEMDGGPRRSARIARARERGQN